MATATYRGIKYDTETPKNDYVGWWNKLHHDASRRLTYRGIRYRTCKTSGSESTYYISGFDCSQKDDAKP